MKITDWLLSKPAAAEGQRSPKKSSLNKKAEEESENCSWSIFNNNKNKMPKDETPGGSKVKGGQAASQRQSAGGQGSTSKPSSSGGSSSRQSSSSGGHQGGSNMTTTAGTHSAVEKAEVILPQTRVKVIMKSSPDIDQVGQDVVYLITKATELFIDHLTMQTYAVANKGKNIEYKHLAEMTQKQENLEFLRDIVPQKMTARAALAEMAKQKALANKEFLE